MSKRRINTISDEQKMTIQLCLGVLLTIFGIALLVVSFLVPPLGVIHSSVLAATGESFTFAGALIGIDYTYRYRRFHTEYTENQRFKKEDTEDEDTVEEDIQQ